MTARAVRNRLNRLVSEGFIEIKAGAIAEKLGFPISADIYMDVEPGLIQEVAQRLVDLDETNYVAITTGDSDFSVSIVAVSMASLQSIITDKLHAIPGVRKTKTYVLTSIIKQGIISGQLESAIIYSPLMLKIFERLKRRDKLRLQET